MAKWNGIQQAGGTNNAPMEYEFLRIDSQE